jgi:hypothetical protein
MPQHWLPFVLVGRKQGWKNSRVLGWLALGAMAHMISTIAIGLLVGYIGHSLNEQLEKLHGLIPGLILIAFGAGYFLSHFHKHIEITNRMAGSTLVLMLALSPCIAVAPFFLIVGPMGLQTLVLMAALMALVSVTSMVIVGWLAAASMKKLRFNWLEHNESKVMGSLLVLLGITFLFFH